MDKETNEKQRLEHPVQILANEAMKTNILLQNIELTLKDIRNSLNKLNHVNGQLESIDSQLRSISADISSKP